MELLQIKFCILGEYSREATILHVCNSILQVETFQKHIVFLQKNLLFIRRIICAISDIYIVTKTMMIQVRIQMLIFTKIALCLASKC